MKLTHDCDKLAGTAKLPHDLPESFQADRVERLGQVNKGQRIEITVLYNALLLELADGKYHVSGSSTCAESALAFREVTLFQMYQ